MEIIYVALGINLVCVLFGGVFSYIVLCTNLLDKNRVQQKKASVADFKKHFPLIFFNIIILQIATASGLYMGLGLFDTAGFPPIWLFVVQFLLFILFDDFFFYWYHRILHENDYLFKKIHKIHHKAIAPFPLDFIYVHPLEWMIGAVGVVIGLFAIVLIFGTVNVYVFWAYAFFRSAHELEIHSGVKTNIFGFIPFYGTTKHHDDHHSMVQGNYASSLTYLDRVFGTVLEDKKHPKKQKEIQQKITQKV